MFSRKKTEEQFRISIPEPCSEDWNKMTVVDREHKHCASCEKLVVDFTSMSNDEIVLFLHHNKEKTCGRFTKTQLDNTYTPLPQITRASNWWKAAMLLPLTLFSKSASAQHDSIVGKDSTMVRNDSTGMANDSGLVASDTLSNTEYVLRDSAIAHVDTLYMGDSILEPVCEPRFQSVELVVTTGSVVYGGFAPVIPTYSGGMSISPAFPMIESIDEHAQLRRDTEESLSETASTLVVDAKDEPVKDEPALPPLPESPWYEAILPPSLRPRRNG